MGLAVSLERMGSVAPTPAEARQFYAESLQVAEALSHSPPVDPKVNGLIRHLRNLLEPAAEHQPDTAPTTQ